MRGVMTKVIERNTTIRHGGPMVFSTAEDNQPAVDTRCFRYMQNGFDNRVLALQARVDPAWRHGVCRRSR